MADKNETRELIERELSQVDREILTQIGVYDAETGKFNVSTRKDLRKLDTMNADGDKSLPVGTVYAAIGVVRQPVSVFLNPDGEVFASSTVVSKTGYKHHLPQFATKEMRAAWKNFCKVLPAYLEAEGTI